MPKEIIPEKVQRQGPPEVYATLRDLIGLQHDAHGFSFLPKHAVHSLLTGRHRSKLRGRGLDFDEVRKYVAGDDIRNIDWRVTARVGKTHTKVFTEERERSVLLIVDQSSSMFFGSQLYMKSIVAAHLAALGAWRVLDVGDRVGGIVFDDEQLDFVSPKRDRRNVQRLLSLVAKKNLALGPSTKESKDNNQLNLSLRHAVQVVSHDFLMVVISDFRKANEETIKNLIQLSRHNDVIAGQIIDPMDAELPKTNIVLSDGIYQTSIEGQRKLIRQFIENQQKKQDWLSLQLKKYGIPHLRFGTSEIASKQLRKMIGGMASAKRRKR